MKPQAKKLKIIFLGTPEFAIPVLSALIDSEYYPEVIITQPDKPTGRKQALTPPPVKAFAADRGIEVYQPETKADLDEFLTRFKPDLCVLVAFGMFIPGKLLDLPKYGWLNVHPSLLPKYRGSSPIQTAILNGDFQTGVSIIKLTERMDAGPVIGQVKLNINSDENSDSLSLKLALSGAELLLSVLPSYLSGSIKPADQNEAEATYCNEIERAQGEIDWKKSAVEIDRQFRAFHPWPGVFTHLDGKRLKIANLSVLEGNFRDNLAFGQVFKGPAGQLAVICGQGAVSLETVQLEGKKEVKGTDFINGQKIIGKILK